MANCTFSDEYFNDLRITWKAWFAMWHQEMGSQIIPFLLKEELSFLLKYNSCHCKNPAGKREVRALC